MKKTRIAMAVAAHPDDTEFTMSGTLMLLGEAGYELHYMNVANGYCGSKPEGRPPVSPATIAQIKRIHKENNPRSTYQPRDFRRSLPQHYRQIHSRDS